MGASLVVRAFVRLHLRLHLNDHRIALVGPTLATPMHVPARIRGESLDSVRGYGLVGTTQAVPRRELFGSWDNREEHVSNEPRKTGQAASRCGERTPFALQMTASVMRVVTSSCCLRRDSRLRRVQLRTAPRAAGTGVRQSVRHAGRRRIRTLAANARGAPRWPPDPTLSVSRPFRAAGTSESFRSAFSAAPQRHRYTSAP